MCVCVYIYIVEHLWGLAHSAGSLIFVHTTRLLMIMPISHISCHILLPKSNHHWFFSWPCVIQPGIVSCPTRSSALCKRWDVPLMPKNGMVQSTRCAYTITYLYNVKLLCACKYIYIYYVCVYICICIWSVVYTCVYIYICIQFYTIYDPHITFHSAILWTAHLSVSRSPCAMARSDCQRAQPPFWW